jgi:hypothetical protein
VICRRRAVKLKQLARRPCIRSVRIQLETTLGFVSPLLSLDVGIRKGQYENERSEVSSEPKQMKHEITTIEACALKSIKTLGNDFTLCLGSHSGICPQI